MSDCLESVESLRQVIHEGEKVYQNLQLEGVSSEDFAPYVHCFSALMTAVFLLKEKKKLVNNSDAIVDLLKIAFENLIRVTNQPVPQTEALIDRVMLASAPLASVYLKCQHEADAKIMVSLKVVRRLQNYSTTRALIFTIKKLTDHPKDREVRCPSNTIEEIGGDLFKEAFNGDLPDRTLISPVALFSWELARLQGL